MKNSYEFFNNIQRQPFLLPALGPEKELGSDLRSSLPVPSRSFGLPWFNRSSTMRFLIIGAGGIGGYYGARLEVGSCSMP